MMNGSPRCHTWEEHENILKKQKQKQFHVLKNLRSQDSGFIFWECSHKLSEFSGNNIPGPCSDNRGSPWIFQRFTVNNVREPGLESTSMKVDV